MGDWWRVILMFVIGGAMLIGQHFNIEYLGTIVLKGTDLNFGWIFVGLGVVLAVIQLFSGKKKKDDSDE